MNVEELTALTGAEVLSMGDGARQILGGMVSDVMSRTIACGFEGMAWITSVSSVNALAVAVMKNAACLLLCGGARMDEETLWRARERGVCVLASEKSAFELAGVLYAEGLRGEERGRPQ